ncbi:MAG: hypothetical protein ABIA04_09705 [Pseudomonadota bacterium]
MKDTILTLIKFGKKEHIESLQKEGKMFINTISYFRKYEGSNQNNVKYKNECLQNLYQSKDVQVFMNEKRINNLTGQVKMKIDCFDDYKLFCMYSLKTARYPDFNKEDIIVDKRNFEFGDYCLLLLEPKEFLNRVKFYRNQKEGSGLDNLQQNIYKSIIIKLNKELNKCQDLQELNMMVPGTI